MGRLNSSNIEATSSFGKPEFKMLFTNSASFLSILINVLSTVVFRYTVVDYHAIDI